MNPILDQDASRSQPLSTILQGLAIMNTHIPSLIRRLYEGDRLFALFMEGWWLFIVFFLDDLLSQCKDRFSKLMEQECSSHKCQISALQLKNKQLQERIAALEQEIQEQNK